MTIDAGALIRGEDGNLYPFCNDCEWKGSAIPVYYPPIPGVNAQYELDQHRVRCAGDNMENGGKIIGYVATLDEFREALATRDIMSIYRILRRHGFSQRKIGAMVEQSQSEVSEILRGRVVTTVSVLERIADGLGVPRDKLGVGFGRARTGLVRSDEQDGDVRRRILLEVVIAATVKVATSGSGANALRLLPAAIPAELSGAHVHAVRAATEQLTGLSRYFGGQASLLGAAACAYLPWLQASGPGSIRDALLAAVADLHTEAGWCHGDEGIDGSGYLARALEFAQAAKDAYSIGYATWHAGMSAILTGHPNHALKLCQLGIAHLTSYRTTSTRRADPAGLAVLLGKLYGTSATSYAMMGASQEADTSLKQADGQPGTAYETGSSGLRNASIHLQLGRLDNAAEWTAAALNGFGTQHRRGHIAAELMQAEIFLRTGDSRGTTLAAEALDRARGVIQSQALRQRRLVPLAQALSGRKDSQCEDLARIAHQLATQE
ncbi:MAG: helix-turn-helix transcriptional regulator [Pseudonocardiales bacterium]|nr:helix-turn-helix transcriptional regulator [Pseudonocardiales bacterium]MBV9164369.1 helix-turn-helix transcriptional regulator [Pseudonocardiales bacterium]